MYLKPEDSIRRESERQTRTHAMLVELAETLLSAEEEGVFEVTIRSHSFTATLPVSFETGASVVIPLWDFVSDRITSLEGRMLVTKSNMGEDAESEYQERIKAERERENQRQARRQAYEQQVAATYSAPPILTAAPDQQPQAQPLPVRQTRPNKAASRKVAAMPVPMNATTQPLPQG